MRMTQRIFVTVVSIFIIMLLIGNSIYGGFFRSHILEEENKQIQSKVGIIIHYMTQLKQSYERTVNDWAHWDETYDFIDSRSNSYVGNYLNSKDFTNLNTNFMIFLNRDEIVEARYYDYGIEDFKPVPPGLLRAIEENKNIWESDETHSFLITSGEDFYIAAVAATRDSLLKKPVNGRLIIGRQIDDEVIYNIEKIAIGSVKFSSLGKIDKNITDRLLQNEKDTDYQHFQIRQDDEIAAYAILPGPYNSSDVIVLNLTAPRDIYRAEMKTLYGLTGLYSLLLLVVAVLSLLYIKKYLLKPIVEMTGKIRAIDPAKEHLEKIETSSIKELEVLSKAINNMLNAIETERAEQKRTAERLRESERSKSVLLSNLPGMAYRCSYDRDWTMLFVSEGCYGLTGYKPESLLNNKERSFSQLIHQDYRDYLWDLWTKSLEIGTQVRTEYPIITAFGEEKWVFEQGRGIYDDDGNVKALEGLIIDISDRKLREEEIQYLNYHDVITGLYNRSYFEEKKKYFNEKSYLPLSIIIGDINGLKLINDALGHAKGDELIAKTAMILMSSCRKEDVLARTGGDEFGILLPNTNADKACTIMKRIQTASMEYNSDAINEAHYVNISLGYATKETEDQDIDRILKQAEDYMYKRKLLEHKSSHSAIISSIRTTMYERSQETEQHAERLTELSREVGIMLNLSQAKLDELQLLATLHDIGKVGINDKILTKEGKLTDDEWTEMKKHPEIGFRIAMASPELVSIAEYILTHHEHWDGKGYPQGIIGEEIPLLSRILAVADAYDAMTQDRIYRKAIPPKEAIAEIRENAGTQFDPNIASIFIEIIYKKEGISAD